MGAEIGAFDPIADIAGRFSIYDAAVPSRETKLDMARRHVRHGRRACTAAFLRAISFDTDFEVRRAYHFRLKLFFRRMRAPTEFLSAGRRYRNWLAI